MKKILSIVLALVLICSFGFSAMALKSAGGTEYHKVVINQTNTGANSEKPKTEIVVKGDSIVVAPATPKENLTFTGISFFKDAAAKVVAVIGVDFKIVAVTFNATGEAAVEGKDYKIDKNSGKVISLNGELLNVEVQPIADNLFISDTFKDASGKEIKPEFKVESDKTADTYSTTVLAVLCLMIMGAGFVAFASKRSYN